MKKLVLPLLMLVGYSSVNAQCVSGLSTNGFSEDFTSVTDLGNQDFSGLYFWGKPELGGNIPANTGFKAVIDRSAGKLDMTLTQASDAYSPFGLSFGDSNGDQTGTAFSVNLTGDKTFSVKVSNNSDSTLGLRMAIKDINGKILNTTAAALNQPFGDAWMYVMGTANLDPHTSTTFTGTFAGAFYSDYDANPKAYSNTFDFTKVTGINFTVVNGHQNNGTSLFNGSADYRSWPLVGVHVTLDDLRLGVCKTGSAVNALSSNEVATVFPNPASEVANITLNLNQVSAVNISVVDMFGRTVKEVVNGKFSNVNEQVNVSGLAQGVYTVNYVVDGATAKSTLLMVK